MIRRAINRVGTGAVCAALALGAAGCGGTEPAPPAETESASAEAVDHTEHAATGASRVFFVAPTDGAMVPTEVTLEFGSEAFEIAAVPPGEIQEADVRPGVGHYHVAVDAECLPPGQIIPKADPWVHFGTGANTADLTLTPGAHTLTVQAGDDQHRTVEGLCETINVTAME